MLTRQMRAVYDAIAVQYASRNTGHVADLLYFGEQLQNLIGKQAHLLDLGCGPGQYIAWWEAQGGAAVGLDLSGSMLALARSQVQGLLVQGDMRLLPFRSRSFDGIWCVASLLHLPKTEVPSALAEIRRVLVPGGALVLALQEGETEGWESTPAGSTLGAVERFFARYSAAEVGHLLAEVGFRVLQQGRSSTETRTWLQFLAQLDPQTDRQRG